MKLTEIQIDRLHVSLLVLGALPLLSLPVLGFVWLRQQDQFWTWLQVSLACASLCFIGNALLTRRQRSLIKLSPSGPSEEWPPRELQPWEKVESLANAADPTDWPITDFPGLVKLGRRTIETVAKHYFPNAEEPIWELSAPHLLRIIELAARDVGRDLREKIPLSDRATIGDLFQAKKWTSFLVTLYDFLRAARMSLNPIEGVAQETKRYFESIAIFGARAEIEAWLLKEYVRRIGRYAIEVYSGSLRFSDEDPLATLTRSSEQDRLADESATREPLRILVLGQTSAGKSSLINALFGKDLAAVDRLPTTQDLCPYQLNREGFTAAIVTDSPGLESLPREKLLAAAAQADMILWVCASNRADRGLDKATLDALRTDVASDPRRHMPPVTVALSHIDRLRPFTEWSPPYDLRDKASVKACNIAEAIIAVATDLAVPPTDIVPVCLESNRLYNVEDALWAAILAVQSEANRLRLLRCLDHARREEKIRLRWEQLKGAGRMLLELPSKIS